jgi:hypothetical protein
MDIWKKDISDREMAIQGLRQRPGGTEVVEEEVRKNIGKPHCEHLKSHCKDFEHYHE